MSVAGEVSAIVIPEGMQGCILRVRVWQASRGSAGLALVSVSVSQHFYHEFYPHGGNIQQKIRGAT